jgi:prolipoprotein diacylglyceryltransferase
MPASTLAAVTLDFPPIADLGPVQVPWRAIALAMAVAVALAWFAHRARAAMPGLATGDIAFIVLGAIPGAVVGGRVVHGIAYAGAYALEPDALFDPGRGTLSLAGAIVGGALTAGWLSGRLGYPARGWADAAAPAVLLAIGAGKLAMLLAGAGQGLPWDGRGGVAFGGVGPWASLDPTIPAYPTQLLEGIWALLGIPVLLLLERRPSLRRPEAGGALALSAVAWWLAGRAAVAVWWRDVPVMGPWGWEGVIALLLFGSSVAWLAWMTLRRRRPSDHGPLRAGRVGS